MPALKLKDKDGNWIPLPTIQGADGKDGTDGKSAYQQAVDAGYTGTEETFYIALVSLEDGPFLPKSGGTLTGDLTLKGPGNFGRKINFGDGDYVHLYEISDDKLEIKASNLDLAVSGVAKYKGKEISVDGHTHPNLGGKRTARFIVGTSAAGWTTADCDYLCDGVDDQVEINAAIQSLPATGGEVVILDGAYNITSTIEVNKAGATLTGNGASTKIQPATSCSPGPLIMCTQPYCAIQHLFITGSVDNSSNYIGVELSYNATNSFVCNNICTTGRTGINVGGSEGCVISQNICTAQSSYGIMLGSGCSKCVVTNNILADNDSGIYQYPTSNYGKSGLHNTITGNVCTGNSEYGLFLSGCSFNVVSSNICNNNNIGIYISGLKGYPCFNNFITGNMCQDNNTGIQLHATSRCTVLGNVCTRGDGTTSKFDSTQYTIRLTGWSDTLCSHNFVACNHIMGKNYVCETYCPDNTFTENKYN